MELPVNYNNINSRQRKLVREEYVKRQNECCSHCGEKLYKNPPSDIRTMKIDLGLFPPNFLKWPVHLHHNHNTGMTIGAVHAYCNAVLWQYHGE